jgi:hypothetical protein
MKVRRQFVIRLGLMTTRILEDSFEKILGYHPRRIGRKIIGCCGYLWLKMKYRKVGVNQ